MSDVGTAARAGIVGVGWDRLRTASPGNHLGSARSPAGRPGNDLPLLLQRIGSEGKAQARQRWPGPVPVPKSAGRPVKVCRYFRDREGAPKRHSPTARQQGSGWQGSEGKGVVAQGWSRPESASRPDQVCCYFAPRGHPGSSRIGSATLRGTGHLTEPPGRTSRGLPDLFEAHGTAWIRPAGRGEETLVGDCPVAAPHSAGRPEKVCRLFVLKREARQRRDLAWSR